MVILGLITYILIGVCIAIGFCAHEYEGYKNSNSKNWGTYCEELNLKEWSVIIILCWSILIISMILCSLAHIPKIIIKKYFDD